MPQMTVEDVMVRSVLSVRPETPLKEVARLFSEHRYRILPVVTEDGAVVGVVAEADFLLKQRGAEAVSRRRFARILGEATESRLQLAKVEADTAGEAMTSPAITIDADRSIGQAAATLIERAVDSLPVMRQGVLVGIVTRSDLVRVYTRTDEQVLEAIRSEIVRWTLLLEPSQFHVTVTDGVVVIRGRVERRSMAEMVGPLVAMHPAVIRVDADVSWEIDDSESEIAYSDLVSTY